MLLNEVKYLIYKPLVHLAFHYLQPFTDFFRVSQEVPSYLEQFLEAPDLFFFVHIVNFSVIEKSSMKLWVYCAFFLLFKTYCCINKDVGIGIADRIGFVKKAA